MSSHTSRSAPFHSLAAYRHTHSTRMHYTTGACLGCFHLDINLVNQLPLKRVARSLFQSFIISTPLCVK